MSSKKTVFNIAKESQAVDRVAQVNMVMNLLAGEPASENGDAGEDASKDVELESAKWASEVDNFFE